MNKNNIFDVLSSKDGISREETSNILLKKEEIRRHHFKSNDLKRLIIRLDFVGVTRIENLVFALKANFRDDFRFKRLPKGNGSTKGLDSLLGIDNGTLSNLPIYSFYSDNYKQPSSRLSINISEFSISLELDCMNYDGFDNYRDLTIEIFQKLNALEPFAEIKKIGIHKTSAFWAEDQKLIRGAIELEALPNPVVEEHFPQCSYSDEFYWIERNVAVKLLRQLWWGTMISGENQKPVLQVALKYDVTRDVSTAQIKQIDKEFLFETLNQINDAHFELFKRSMTEQYLNRHCHD